MTPQTRFSFFPLPGRDNEALLRLNGCAASGRAEEPHSPRWKRLFDLVFVFATAFVWLPLMLIIMWVIKIASPGPVFYRQARVGCRGRPFMIFKFRSMKMNAETGSHEKYLAQLMQQGGPMTKLDEYDPRLIPFGKFLRASGLDELPQIFNILRGEMSLVGPRPCTTVEFARYEAWQKDRVKVQPGVTGYWQVHGKNRTTFDEMIAMDLLYAANLSLRLDLAIIFKTFPVLVQEAFFTPPARLPLTNLQELGAGSLRPQMVPIQDDGRTTGLRGFDGLRR